MSLHSPIRIVGAAIQVAVTDASSSTTIPNDFSGNRAKALMLFADNAANLALFRTGAGPQTVLLSDSSIPQFVYPGLSLIVPGGHDEIGLRIATGTVNVSITPIAPRRDLMRIGGNADALIAAVASARIAIPTDASGNRAKWVMIASDEGSNEARFRVGNSTVVALITDTMVPLYGVPLVLDVRTETDIAAIRTGGSDVNLHVTPLDSPGS